MATVEKPASVGRQTYEAVSDLIKGGMKPTVAFSTYGEREGKSAATVATAYYRVARGEADAPTNSRPRNVTRQLGRPKGSTNKATISTRTVSARITQALKKIEEGLQEIDALMPKIKDADNYQEIVRLLSR